MEFRFNVGDFVVLEGSVCAETVAIVQYRAKVNPLNENNAYTVVTSWGFVNQLEKYMRFAKYDEIIAFLRNIDTLDNEDEEENGIKTIVKELAIKGGNQVAEEYYTESELKQIDPETADTVDVLVKMSVCKNGSIFVTTADKFYTVEQFKDENLDSTIDRAVSLLKDVAKKEIEGRNEIKSGDRYWRYASAIDGITETAVYDTRNIQCLVDKQIGNMAHSQKELLSKKEDILNNLIKIVK